jgi:hypothetical protein
MRDEARQLNFDLLSRQIFRAKHTQDIEDPSFDEQIEFRLQLLRHYEKEEQAVRALI